MGPKRFLVLSDSDSFSAPLNVHILTLTLLFTGVVVLYHPEGHSKSWRELLWSCLMPPGHIRPGDPVNWILGWISKCK